MQWFDSARVRLRLLLNRRSAESRMDDEFRFHLEMEADQLMRARGLAADEARRQALASFGGVQKHRQELRDGRGLVWLGSLSLDVKLGLRMLLKYPGLTLAGGLAIAIAIGVGAGWYDLIGKIMTPRIPLPDGDRIVVIETQDARTNALEPRVLRDFVEWQRELRSIGELGAYRTDTRNLIVGHASPHPIQVAELTTAAFTTARVPPLRGRGLVDSDQVPGAPGVVVLGYDIWKHALHGREDVLGLVVRLGNTPATVVGVMPEGFGYPVNHDAWAPLLLRSSYEPLEGAAVSIIGRLAPGNSLEQANAEVGAIGQRTARAFAATHEHLRPAVTRLGAGTDLLDVAALAARNVPVLLVLTIACMSVGTLVYARTATREGEIAIRAALGAEPRRLLTAIFGRATRQLAFGLVVGTVLAIGVFQSADVGPGKASVVVAAVGVLMLGVGLLAASGPARRGLRIQPSDALRGDG